MKCHNCKANVNLTRCEGKCGQDFCQNCLRISPEKDKNGFEVFLSKCGVCYPKQEVSPKSPCSKCKKIDTLNNCGGCKKKFCGCCTAHSILMSPDGTRLTIYKCQSCAGPEYFGPTTPAPESTKKRPCSNCKVVALRKKCGICQKKLCEKCLISTRDHISGEMVRKCIKCNPVQVNASDDSSVVI